MDAMQDLELPIRLAQHRCGSKIKAKELVTALLRHYPIGSVVSPRDTPVVMALLQLHPRATEKIGVGVDHFSVQSYYDGSEKSKHFYLHRLDGSHTDFSYRKCLRLGWQSDSTNTGRTGLDGQRRITRGLGAAGR
ncbi:hypothetical protein WJX72_004940 [[Myrmecia] bisecta]|uniref:Uncharacterized protein n=1 Tax=[Myrmecia] bisecta TaxID=41462 RepID=A0AAW1P9M2_9CHLO